MHLVGDAFQPLHVAYAEDRGGNQCRLYWFSRPSNLHRLWDSGLIAYQGLSFTEMAASLQRRYPSLKAPSTLPAFDPDVLSGLYPEGVKPGHCPNARHQWPKLSYAYAYQQTELLNKRLMQAGLFLAHVLNR